MSYLFSGFLYKKKSNFTTWLTKAIKQTEKWPVPHPHPHEYYVLSNINNEYDAIYYIVQGYDTKAKCFSCQTEFFQVDEFADIVGLIAIKESVKNEFYVFHWNDMSGYQQTRKVKRNDDVIFTYQDNKIDVTIIEGKENVKKQKPFLFLKKETGVDVSKLINKYAEINEKSTVLFHFVKGKNI